MRRIVAAPESETDWPAAELLEGDRVVVTLWWPRHKPTPRLATENGATPPTAEELCEMHKALREVMKNEQEVPSGSDT